MPSKPTTDNGDNKLTNAVRLSNIELQLRYLTESIKTLGDKVDKTETTRNANLLDYVQQHGKVVADASDANKKVDALRAEFNASEVDTDDCFDTIEKRFDAWDKTLSPLFTAHKILVWVAIFFASSIGLLLWGIFTHTVTISYLK